MSLIAAESWLGSIVESMAVASSPPMVATLPSLHKSLAVDDSDRCSGERWADGSLDSRLPEGGAGPGVVHRVLAMR